MITDSVSHITVDVRPFDNLSEKKGFDHFVRGFTDDIVTDLSRFGSLSIIKTRDDQPQSSDTDYSIQGSFRTYANKVRITTQLIKNEDQSIVFAARHDEDFDELLSIQDQITQQLVHILQQQINNHLTANAHRKPQTKVAAYDYWLRGMEELKKGTVESDTQARELFNQALAIDPHYARAYTGLSLSYFNEWSCQLWTRWEVSKTGAGEFAQKALQLDESEYEAYAVMGRVHLYDGNYEKAEHCLRKSMQLNPNDADNLVYIASCLCFLGLNDEAVEVYEKALQVNPYKPDWYYSYGTLIHLEVGDYEMSQASGERIALDGFWVDFPAYMAGVYYFLGKKEQMSKAWQVYLELFSEKIAQKKSGIEEDAIHWFMNVNPYRRASRLQPFWDYLKQRNGISLESMSVSLDYPSPPANSFIQEGDLWQICYDGHSVTLRGSKGLNDIALLLKQAGKELHCTELMGTAVVNEEGAEVMDQRARQEYERRIISLREELEEAENMNNIELASKLNQEYEELVAHLSKSLGLAGETRKTGSSVEKARAAVTLRIRGTIKKIEKVHESLAQHLARSIKTGTFCSYEPEKEVDWLV